MERRIKILYWLTVVALLLLVLLQGYWLFNQYVHTLKQYENELFDKTIEVSQIDREVRKRLHDKRFKIVTQWEMEVKQDSTSIFNPELSWVFDTYIINKNEITHCDSLSLQQIDSLSEIDKGVKKYRFDIKAPNREHDAYEVLERFQINKLCPFSIERFDSLLQTQGIKPLLVKIEAVDSILWNPHKTSCSSLWNPVMEVTYPFDILGKEQVRLTYQLGISPILGRMLESLIGSIILSFLLIFCLIYQTKTIFKQRRIDELRKDFIKTMIHELKRPVATLKMCISFMKNDRMMTDKAIKEDIIRSSQNELDNLSSYFSKLRDLTYGDMEEIPLNLSAFNLKELIEECIDKQHLPTDRQIVIKSSFDNNDDEITADRMHIANIFYNLLENAVKYSEGETSILIDCRSVSENYRIEISDNGFGIPSGECTRVFDKYFRSTSIEDKNIPGIGLGLCYVKLLVTAHNGKISLESKLGTGSKFIIEIPKKQ
ncbi:MAG: HAMP domain-containing histidine kinase [Prevotella sp.]|jgi:two-component system phosphate regulon sensor histidine kinase PhoR|nr:HAMP domain-containing histidine kinase [Prevotella sp.]